MKSTTWMDLAQLIGIAGILATLVVLIVETKQTQDIARAEYHARNIANSNFRSDARMEYADIWLKGAAGEELSDVEEEIFYHLVHIENRLAFHGAQQSELLRGSQASIDLHLSTFAGFLYENPGAYTVWRAHEDWNSKYRRFEDSSERITSSWVNTIEEKMERIRQAEATTE